jgi:hypothetical protein
MLITRFMTPDGVGEVTDFMPVAGSRPTDRHRLVRQLRTVRGTMRFVMEVRPRFDYGRAPHKLEITDDGFVFSADGMELTLNPVGERAVSLGDQGLTVERLGDDIRITRTLREGESGGVVLESMGGQPRRIPPAELEQLSEDTVAFWRGWVGHSTTGGAGGRWCAGAGLCGGSRRVRALAARPRRGKQRPRRSSAEDHVPGGRLFGPE